MSENHEKSWKWMLGAIVAVAILAVFFTRNRKPTIDEQVEAIKNHKSIPFLIQKLSDPNPRIRDAATARLFLWLPHEDAHFKQLMKLKTVSSIRILGSAIREDKKDGPDVDVVRYLINLLDEKESDEIRIAAIEELGLTRSELAERPLRRLQNADRDLEVASIRALWRITDRSQGLTERLLILAAQADSKKREPIDILFGNMSMKAFDDLVQATWTSLPADQRALESKVQRLARHYLARLGEQAVPKMIARLKNPSEYSFAKEGIIDALGEMGEKAKDCEPVLVTFIKLRPDEVQFQSATREPAIAWVATAITLTRNQGAGVSAFLAPLTSQGLFDALKRSLALREKMRLHVRRRLRQAALQALPKVGVASRVAVGELLKLWAITESDPPARYWETAVAATRRTTSRGSPKQ